MNILLTEIQPLAAEPQAVPATAVAAVPEKPISFRQELALASDTQSQAPEINEFIETSAISSRVAEAVPTDLPAAAWDDYLVKADTPSAAAADVPLVVLAASSPELADATAAPVPGSPQAIRINLPTGEELPPGGTGLPAAGLADELPRHDDAAETVTMAAMPNPAAAVAVREITVEVAAPVAAARPETPLAAGITPATPLAREAVAIAPASASTPPESTLTPVLAAATPGIAMPAAATANGSGERASTPGPAAASTPAAKEVAALAVRANQPRPLDTDADMSTAAESGRREAPPRAPLAGEGSPRPLPVQAGTERPEPAAVAEIARTIDPRVDRQATGTAPAEPPGGETGATRSDPTSIPSAPQAAAAQATSHAYHHIAAPLAAVPAQAPAGNSGALPTPLDVLNLAQSADGQEPANGLGERVSWMINQKQNLATIRLDPPLLGKLDVQVRVSDDATTVHIHTQHAQTRDLIESASPRLRDFLQDSGYQNVSVDVSHRQDQQQQSRTSQAAADGGGWRDEAEAESATDHQRRGDRRYYASDGLLDTFA